MGDRDATKEDRHPATEPLGPVAGEVVAATFGFNDGIRGFLDTVPNLERPGQMPYGVHLECAEAGLLIRGRGDVFVYPANTLVPEDPKLTWQKVWVEDWHFYPDHRPRPMNDWVQRANHLLVKDFLEAIEQNRTPPTSGRDARLALEMIQGVYASHFQRGARTSIPLKERRHPRGEI